MIQHTGNLTRGTTVRDSSARTVAGQEKGRSRRALRLAAGGAAPAVVGLGAIPAFADHSLDLDEAHDEEVDEFAGAALVDLAEVDDDLPSDVELDYEPDDSLTTEAGEESGDALSDVDEPDAEDEPSDA